jgi:hypothetical protein
LSRFLKKNVGSKLLGEVTQESEIRQLVQKTARDLVVVTADKPGRRPAISELLKEFLAPRISAVTPHENHAVCYATSLGIHADEIESSELRLLAALKRAVQIVSSSSVVVAAARQIVASSIGQHSILRRVFFKASEETIFGIIRGTAKPTGEVS